LAAGKRADDLVKGSRDRVSHAAIEEAVRLVTKQFLKTLPALDFAA
jgi:hypothetical protein